MTLKETNSRNDLTRKKEQEKKYEATSSISLSFENDTSLYLRDRKATPVLNDILNDETLKRFFFSLDRRHSYLLSDEGTKLENDQNEEIPIPEKEKKLIQSYLDKYEDYGGRLEKNGDQYIDLMTENVSCHYDVNLLLGNREGYDHPLQSTPKSVVNRFFQGSFRAHSSYQVLATTWGLLPEENGFPLNRQFYLLEDGKQIFFSARIDKNVEKAYCIHNVNHSTIFYRLKSGLEIRREIFLLPQKEGLPSAVEIQTIDIRNCSKRKRDLSIVYVGMFGFSNPHCQEEDVIYSTLVSQAQVIQDEKSRIIALTPDYYPEYFKREIRFVTLKDDDSYIDSFTSDYISFIGTGTMDHPEHLNHLGNRLTRKGPNLFALGKSFNLDEGKEERIDTFTGMVDATQSKGNDHLKILNAQLERLLEEYRTRKEVEEALKEVKKNFRDYSSFLQIEESEDIRKNSYINSALPFQVLYQTFVSRSFAMTQKGYREIGFREIQDLYASMYYLNQEGKKGLIQKLLSQWIENVYPFGYANHNFFYQGKEPGQSSDDPLWLILALGHYLDLTDDYDFLDHKFVMAGSKKERKLYDTLKAILRYSGEISIGKHMLPLLDMADWNDCLRIDSDYLNGPEKEKAYRHQLKTKHQKTGVPLESDYSESVMDGFLLVIALSDMEKIAKRRKDENTLSWLKQLKKEKIHHLNHDAYIEGYYARVLLNRRCSKADYIGSGKDGLSIEEGLDGSYYLNSFSWSLLSDVASEKRIKEMLAKVDTYLKSPAGYKLCTGHDLSLAGAKSSSTDHYFIGDRENGGVFKHATMMLTRALLYRAKTVKDKELKEQMVKDAYFMIDLVYPFNTLENVELYKGNPRFCTQYNNSITEENIGPILSGTATWLTLTIFEALGIRIENSTLILSPMLRKEEEEVTYTIKNKEAILRIRIKKAKGTLCEKETEEVEIDGNKVKGNRIRLPIAGKHEIEVSYR